jgi:hypothetical protein
MVKRVFGEPNLVTVTFERDSEEPERLAVADGWLAAVVGVGPRHRHRFAKLFRKLAPRMSRPRKVITAERPTTSVAQITTKLQSNIFAISNLFLAPSVESSPEGR